MLEESGFYSEHLQRISANIMGGLLALFAVVFVGIAIAVRAFRWARRRIDDLRLFLAFLAFAMSADVIGAYRAHRSATTEIRNIRHRLMIADAAGYPCADVLVAFADYNAAVEGALESVPFAYKMNAANLDGRWAEYQRDRDEARATREGAR